MMQTNKSIFLTLLLVMGLNLLFAQSSCFNISPYKEVDKGRDVDGRTIEDYYSFFKDCNMPKFKAYTMDSILITDSILRGKMVVIDFWFANCSPCIAAIPYLNRLVDSLKNEDIVFIAISKDDKSTWNKRTADVFRFLHVFGGNYLAELFHVSGYPTSIIFDRNGKVKSYEIGFATKISNDNSDIISDKVNETLKIIRGS